MNAIVILDSYQEYLRCSVAESEQKVLGVYLKKRRNEVGMSVLKLARKTGLSEDAIKAAEAGRNTTTKTVICICKALDILPVDTAQIELVADLVAILKRYMDTQLSKNMTV